MLHLALAAVVAAAQSPPTAQEIYARALARLHSIPQQPYLIYVMAQENHNVDGTAPFALTEIVVERRSDRASFNTVQGGDVPSDSVVVGKHYLVPDMFLSAAPPPPDAIGAVPQLDELRTIGTVTAIASPAYDVTMKATGSDVPLEDLPGCGKVVHLYLRPVRNLERYNVRELWVRPSDYVLCQARYNSRFFEAGNVNTDSALEVTAKLDDSGFVTSWRDTGRVNLPVTRSPIASASSPTDTGGARSAPLSFSTVGGGSFSRFTWKDAMPDYMFDQKLWDAHVKAAHASPTASP